VELQLNEGDPDGVPNGDLDGAAGDPDGVPDGVSEGDTDGDADGTTGRRSYRRSGRTPEVPAKQRSPKCPPTITPVPVSPVTVNLLQSLSHPMLERPQPADGHAKFRDQ
jgi:hypothetical protein